ncbi:DIP1984 family protein [Paenibacillus sp. 19GGS1-52]|uniref:DIP1984 family protein n=1 Tax=Paenibacillus sp. 19GGS1-52 TaxID=2758563 RepID=UPI001EFB2E44|nr:DIP1984 family protein [Paenibacillus sp. 19GGS1-52]ULO09817.1 DIP1984 family protein [Paenibacillus sp. 19GGS1-52]
MRLAEALVRRADCQRKVAQIKQRLGRVIKVQEGETPSESPTELLDELSQTLGDLAVWVKKINKTNAFSPFDTSISLAEALAERDRIMQHRNILNELLNEASIKQERYSRQEVKFHTTVEIVALQKEVDELSRKYRELDFKIQEKNWSTDVLDN